jgi:cystathionine beta-lyase family protein involved in aluminum resistance
MYFGYNIDEKLVQEATDAEKVLAPMYEKFEKNALLCSAKVLKAFQDNRLASSDFVETTGYGFYDAGRNKLEKVYAQIFGTEDALVRPQIMSGTHAIALTYSGLLKYGDVCISISGKPYDSLQTIIGLSGNSRNSLIKNGIKYEQIELIDDDFDIEKIVARLKKSKVKLVEIQRSRGYSSRKSLSIEKIARVCKAVKQASPDTIIMVDNCYGDFVEDKEPSNVGADVVVGSHMKNLGGGIAKTGGYIVGKKDLILDIAERFSAPGLGKDIGANLNQNYNFFKGLYYAPSVVCSCLKTMAFASYILAKHGYVVSPKFDEHRADIIQAVELGTADNLVKFCRGLQMGAPVESFVEPVPAPMPGYAFDEIMACGSFVTGATNELSCDAPMTAPFTAFMQGGLTYEYGKLGILIALNLMLKK